MKFGNLSANSSSPPKLKKLYRLGTPLWVWGTTLTFASSLLIISFIYYHSYTIHNLAWLDSIFNTSRIKAFEQAAALDNYPKIIAIGTSLTRYGLYKDAAMEHFAALHGINIHFLRFTKSNGELPDFKTLATYLLSVKPTIIFLESALFTRNTQANKINYYWEIKHKYYLRYLIRKYVFKTYSSPERDQGNFIDINWNQIATNTNLAQYQKIFANFRVRDISYGNSYRDFFKKASEKGIQIILIDLSRPKNTWDIMPPDTEKNITHLMEQYQARYKIKYLRFPYKLKQDYYIDFGHLRLAGRKFYSKWLLQQIPNLLKQQNPSKAR
jgi:hypothetical protein